MEKAKVNKEQAERLDFFKKGFNFQHLVEKKLRGFILERNRCLNTLLFEDFVKALLNGYEINIPPVPELKTDKIEIGYNNRQDNLTKGNEIYINTNFNGYSIEEAKEIRDGIDVLLYHYYQYVKQGDKQ